MSQEDLPVLIQRVLVLVVAPELAPEPALVLALVVGPALVPEPGAQLVLELAPELVLVLAPELEQIIALVDELAPDVTTEADGFVEQP